mgnify:CR=1 FL=1
MSKLKRQEDANQVSEAGMFYPTGHIVAGLADAASLPRRAICGRRQAYRSSSISACSSRAPSQRPPIIRFHKSPR